MLAAITSRSQPPITRVASLELVAGREHVDGVVAEVREPQVVQQQAAVGVRVGAHPPLARGCDRHRLRRAGARARRRAPRAGRSASTPRGRWTCSGFSASWASGTWCARKVPSTGRPSTSLGPVQPFGVRRTIIGQRGRSLLPPVARVVLDPPDLVDDLVERGGHRLVHRLGLVALDEPRAVAVAGHQRVELVVRDPGQDGRVGDLVAVEVQDRQHRAVARRVEELVAVPARGQRAGLRLAVADHAGHEQVRVVERRAVGVRQRVAELAALVDRAGRLRRDVAGDAARERELAEQPPHALLVLRDVRVDLAVGALEPGVGDEAGAAVARARRRRSRSGRVPRSRG